MSKPTVVLCAEVRTAIGIYNGSLKGVAATELGAAAIRRGIVTLCIGGGQGIALALERL